MMKKKFNFNRKKVVAIKDEDILEFESIKAASIFAGFKSSESMRVVIKKRKGLHKGYKYKYKD